MKFLKHSNKTVCVDSLNIKLIQDIYCDSDQYIVVSSKFVGNNVDDMIVIFDVFDSISDAEQYINNNVVLDVNEAKYSEDQLATLDRAFTTADDNFKPLIVKNTHLIKNVYSTDDVVYVQHIEYANKCSLSDKNVVISSCYCYKENGEHWTKSAKVWKELTVHNNIDECVSAAKMIVEANNEAIISLNEIVAS